MKKERFEAFLAANDKRIFRYILNLCGSEQDTHDLVQDVFIAIYQNLDRIDEVTALAYTYKTAHNKCMSYMKQRSRYVNVDPIKFVNIADKPTAEPEPDYSELHKAVVELPHRLAAVIQLQYYDNLSYKEISAALGISVKAVESLLVRAKRILRKKIVQVTK